MIEDAADLVEHLDSRSERKIQIDLVRALRSALDDAHAARRRTTEAAIARLLAREADELARLNQIALPLPQGELVTVTALELLRGGRAHALALAAAREARATSRDARARRRARAESQSTLWEVL